MCHFFIKTPPIARKVLAIEGITLILIYHANNPTNAAVNNETKIPANSIIGTYLETKSAVFLSTIPFNVPIIIPIVEKLANDTKNVEITALW